MERESIENWETEVVIGEERGSSSGEPGEEKVGEFPVALLLREGETPPEPEAYLLRLKRERKPIEGDWGIEGDEGEEGSPVRRSRVAELAGPIEELVEWLLPFPRLGRRVLVVVARAFLRLLRTHLISENKQS